MSTSPSQPRTGLVVAVLLGIALFPLVLRSDSDATSSREGERTLYVELFAKSLGYPSDSFPVLFEYRDGSRLIATERVIMNLGRSESALVEVPQAKERFLADSPQVQLLVWANGLLIGEFDSRLLIAYNNQLAGFASAGGERQQDPQSLGRPGPSAVCDSPCGGGCKPYQDYDCDGVINSTDNCIDEHNPSQANCDGDAWGDECDWPDAIYQPTGPVKTCMTDKDQHVPHFDFEHHVEQRLVDVSSCGSPDKWNRWVRAHAHCIGLTDQFCCENGIGGSINAVGDSVTYWCAQANRNKDRCN